MLTRGRYQKTSDIYQRVIHPMFLCISVTEDVLRATRLQYGAPQHCAEDEIRVVIDDPKIVRARLCILLNSFPSHRGPKDRSLL